MIAEPSAGFWLAVGVMLIGLVGTVIPGIPGVILIWAAAVVYAIAEGFARVGIPLLVLLTLLGAAGATSDIWVSHYLGRAGGASNRALVAGMVFGLVGMFIGLFFAGIGAIPGALIGSIGGILLVEYRRRRSLPGAARGAAGWLLGYLLSALVEFTIGLVMVGLFYWQAGGKL